MKSSPIYKIKTLLLLLTLVGFYDSVYSQELYVDPNAASSINEANTTTGWSGGAQITSESGDTQEGSYALKITTVSQSGRNADYGFSATVGKKYLIKIWAKEGTQHYNPSFANWTGVSGFTTKSITGASWTEYRFVVTATSTTPVIKVYSNPINGWTAGDHIWIDNISITELDTWTDGVNIHTQSNAASIDNETNTTTGWTGDADISVLSGESHSGTYSLKAATSSSQGRMMEYTFNATIGDYYYIDIWARVGSQHYSPAFANWSGVSGFSTTGITSTQWEQFSFVVEATSSNPVIKVYTNPTHTINVGDAVYIDHVYIASLSDSQDTNNPNYLSPVFSNENYIYTRTYQQAMPHPDSIALNKDVIEQVSYFDGLGRPMQQVGVKASPDIKDIVTHIGYDAYGRQDKEWLPHQATGVLGSYRSTDPAGSTQSYYETHFPEDVVMGNANPYSEKAFEASPLNRVLQQAAPGADWRLSEGNTIDFTYDTNTANEVRLFRVGFINNDTEDPELVLDTQGHYGTGELNKTITYDENHTTGVLHSMEEFKDRQGRVVLKRTYGPSDVDMNGTISGSELTMAHDTYYVYDDYGNLTYVLPPKLNATTATLSTINSNLATLGYQYRYDERNRLVEKQLPGKEVGYIVYNKLDQPILTQDANQRENDKWLFTKYDAFGRVIYTGIYNSSTASREVVQTAADSFTAQYETKVPTALSLGGGDVYYSNNTYPNTIADITELHTVNYYDGYEDTDGLSVPGTVKGEVTAGGVALKGLSTVSKVWVLGENDWITTITGYDLKGRAIYTASKNPYLNTTTVMEDKLDFVGKVTETTTTHTRGSETILTTDHFSYDHTGRLKKHTQTLDGATEVIAENIYNDLGQLISKGVGNTEGNSRLQTVNYQYNIRGWLKKINDPSTLSDDLFGFEVRYNNPTGGTPLYNGNISQTVWNTQSVNITSNPVSNEYTYSYDALNRITSAIDNTTNYNVNGITYDQNGNITALQRKGALVSIPSSPSDFGMMDQLSYTYDAGNQLSAVSDQVTGVTSEAHFEDGNSGTDYDYDANGNLVQDLNKGILANGITYNHLNLPSSIDIGTGNISYIYDATGTKLRKIVSGGATTDYSGNYIYENGDLQFFSHPEGYVNTEGSGYEYVYQYKDHLGNIRLNYTDNPSNPGTPTIIEESNYYPFGLQHKGYNNHIIGTENNYHTFQGKENQKELSLNWHDFHARQYMGDIGRTTTQDPLAEDFYSVSSYSFLNNSPPNFVDQDGRAAFNPIYDEGGNFLGTDEYGLKGEAIIYGGEFTQGMSQSDILEGGGQFLSDYASNLPGDQFAKFDDPTWNKAFSHSYDLKDRPDYDGVLTLSEANAWARNGNGEPLFVDVGKIDLSTIDMGDFRNKQGFYRTSDYFNFINPLQPDYFNKSVGEVYGSIKLSVLNPNSGEVRLGGANGLIDVYNFEQHKGSGAKIWTRNQLTKYGKYKATVNGRYNITDFSIYGYGKAYLNNLGGY